MEIRATNGAPRTHRGFLWSKIMDIMIGPSVAQGDIMYRDATGWTSLAAGTSGYVLKTNGAAANPSWTASAGISGNGMTYIGGTTLGSAAQTVTLGSLDLDTDQAYYVAYELKGNSVGAFDVSVQMNSDSTAANYDREQVGFNGSTTGSSRSNTAAITTGIATAGEMSGYLTLRRNINSKANALAWFTSLATTSINMGMTVIQWRTANNVTDFGLRASVANAFATGTYIKVWRIHT